MGAGQAADDLIALTGSRARAAILSVLYGDEPFPRHPTEIANVTGVPRSSVQDELQRLVAAGLVIRGKAWGLTLERAERVESYGRPYYANEAAPAYPEIRTIVAKSRGIAACVRVALPQHARLAWITGAYALLRAGRRDTIAVVAIGEPKRLIEKGIQGLDAKLGRAVKLTVIAADEWTARVDKRELTVLRLRHGPKLWLRGDAVALYQMEKRQRESKEFLKKVIATGLDLTDEWDEDWDPFAPKPW